MSAFDTVEAVQKKLGSAGYIASDGLAVSLFLALTKQRALFLEGEAGVGKTEIAKMLAHVLDRDLIRLQCYEGLDINQAAYEWNYARQLVEIQATGEEHPFSRASLNEMLDLAETGCNSLFDLQRRAVQDAGF